jgi:hypothetical protein
MKRGVQKLLGLADLDDLDANNAAKASFEVTERPLSAR